jgi:mono/diheme cytochrome c family protein
LSARERSFIIRGMKSFVLLVSLVAAACGSKTPSTTSPGSGPATATAALPDVPFEKLDHDQRIQFMKEKVVPAMAPVFKQHDAKKYSEFGCKTCHGDGAEKGEFDMPFGGLPKLNFADMSKFKKEDLEWMGKDVKPAMAKLLQEAEYSDENPKGFGCLHCHTQEGK